MLSYRSIVNAKVKYIEWTAHRFLTSMRVTMTESGLLSPQFGTRFGFEEHSDDLTK